MSDGQEKARMRRGGLLGILSFCVLWGLCICCILLGRTASSRMPSWVNRVMEEKNPAGILQAETDIYAERPFCYILRDVRTGALSRGNSGLLEDLAVKRQQAVGNFLVEVSGEDQRTPFSLQGIRVLRGMTAAKRFERSVSGAVQDSLVYVGVDDLLVSKGDSLWGTAGPDGEKGETAKYQVLLAYWKYRQQTVAQGRLGEAFWGPVIFSALLLLVFGYSLYALRERMVLNFSRQMLCTVGIALHIALLCIGVYFLPDSASIPSFYFYALLPLSLSPALMAHLLGRRIGACIALLLSSLTPLLLPCVYPFVLFVFCLLCSVVAVFFFHDVRRREQFLLGGLLLGGVIFFVQLFQVWCRGVEWVWYPQSGFWLSLGLCVGGHVGLDLLALLLGPVILERLFDVTTEFTLDELNSREHPLLMRLRKEAPGTYEHSLNVANLASDAARSIGANEKLAEVAAYFHDIGKLEQPGFFGENRQENGEDPLAGMTALECCRALRHHVEYGRELAKKAHLPRAVQEVCFQHHGNSVMNGFYLRAVKEAEEAGNPQPKAEDYRYQAMLPVSTEAVLVMMADCCEAAARAWDRQWLKEGKAMTQHSLLAALQGLLEEKFQDGQFDAARMTLAEFRIALSSMVETLLAVRHVRPEYPSVPKAPSGEEAKAPQEGRSQDAAPTVGEKGRGAGGEAVTVAENAMPKKMDGTASQDAEADARLGE